MATTDLKKINRPIHHLLNIRAYLIYEAKMINFVFLSRLVDLMVRLAVNEENLSKPLVDLSAMVGLDGVPLHFQLFPKLWIDIFNTKQIDRKFIMMLVTSHGFLEYVDAVLLDERSSLNNSHVFNFLLNFFPKVRFFTL